MSNQLFVEVPPHVSEQLHAQLMRDLGQFEEPFILGARLVPLINESLPDGWHYRDFFAPGVAPNLRVFVETWLTGIIALTARKQGADSFYEIVAGRPSSGDAPVGGGELWRTFVAVNPALKIVYTPGLAALSLARLTADVIAPSVVVASLTMHEHKAMCHAFADRLKQDGMDIPALEDLLTTYSSDSYPSWLRVLRKQSPPLDKAWGSFRQSQIALIFGQRLTALGVAASHIETLKQVLLQDQAAAHSRPSTVQPVSVVEQALEDGKGITEKRARELLRSAIDRCTYEELREIRIPFGLVIDILGTSR